MTVLMEFVGCGFFALVFSEGSQHSSGGRAAWLTRFSPSLVDARANVFRFDTNVLDLSYALHITRVYSTSS
jgi:hypothetical protein